MPRLLLLLKSLTILVLSVPATAAQGQPSSPHSFLRRAGDDLIERVATYSQENPGKPGVVASWTGAKAGAPLVFGTYADLEPSLGLVPVLDGSNRWIGSVGVDAVEGQWLWYVETERPLDPPASVRVVVDALRRESRIPQGSKLDHRLILAPDRRLYWCLTWVDSAGTRGETFADLWDPSRSPDQRTREDLLESKPSPTPLLQRFQPPSPSPSTGGRNSYPDEFDLTVPHYYQRSPYHCAPASLEMVLDYWGEHIEQRTIGYVCNTVNARGTDPNDVARAAHFSHLSTSVQYSGLVGYVERGLGYAALENNWSHHPHFDRRYEDLKQLISSGYPLFIASWYTASHAIGHARVVKGYSDPLDVFIVHDPYYGGQYVGPDIHMRQELLVDNLWKFGQLGRWAVLALPWNVTVSSPDSVEAFRETTIRAAIRYPGPNAFTGQDPVESPQATLELGKGLQLAVGESATKPLPGIHLSGTVDTLDWRVVPSENLVGLVGLKVTASGMMTDTAHSYGEYTDEIGGVAVDSLFVLPPAPIALESFEAAKRTWNRPCQLAHEQRYGSRKPRIVRA